MAQRRISSPLTPESADLAARPSQPIIQRPYNPPKAKPKASGRSKAKPIIIDDDEDDLSSVNDDGVVPSKARTAIKSEEREGSTGRDKRKKKVLIPEDGQYASRPSLS